MLIVAVGVSGSNIAAREKVATLIEAVRAGPVLKLIFT